jgi:negative regulator of flagellin synthesis FlgM
MERIMKIGNSVESTAVPAAAAKPAPADANKSTASLSGPAAASTQVELSSTATTLRAGTTQATSADFDTEKVNRISQAIADGSFTVNPEAIADKLISNAQELLSKGQR